MSRIPYRCSTADEYDRLLRDYYAAESADAYYHWEKLPFDQALNDENSWDTALWEPDTLVMTLGDNIHFCRKKDVVQCYFGGWLSNESLVLYEHNLNNFIYEDTILKRYLTNKIENIGTKIIRAALIEFDFERPSFDKGAKCSWTVRKSRYSNNTEYCCNDILKDTKIDNIDYEYEGYGCFDKAGRYALYGIESKYEVVYTPMKKTINGVKQYGFVKNYAEGEEFKETIGDYFGQDIIYTLRDCYLVKDFVGE